MTQSFKPAPYHHTQQLKFKHLDLNDLFIFPAAHGCPWSGPFMKISARRYVQVEVSGLWGSRLVPHIKPGAIVHNVGSINTPVSDAIHTYLTH
jgi:hypothetical protein